MAFTCSISNNTSKVLYYTAPDTKGEVGEYVDRVRSTSAAILPNNSYTFGANGMAISTTKGKWFNTKYVKTVHVKK